VFRCNQEAHRHFQGRVSVYHVLKEKGCYPEGCLYFFWHCMLLEKGNPCILGYKSVGRRCRGCTYYNDEKVHLQPERILDEKAYRDFLDELDIFESWLERVRYKHHAIAGRIKIIKPWFEITRLHCENHLRLRGYLLIFKRGFIGNESFEDTFYVRVSERLMKIYGFVPKMKIELFGEVREDRGRIVIHRPRTIEIQSRGWGRPWNRDRALVAVRTASLLTIQTDQCLSCPWGALADVIQRQDDEVNRYRHLYCLKGVANPEGCYVQASEKKEL
jgi:hypothetical protein